MQKLWFFTDKVFQKTFSEISLFSDHDFNHLDHGHHYHYHCRDYHHYHHHGDYHYGHSYHYYHHCYIIMTINNIIITITFIIINIIIINIIITIQSIIINSLINNIILRIKLFLTILSENYLPITPRKLWQPQKL